MKNSEWAPGVYEEFMETYDFARCQRPDGSYYGTGGTCRKGTLAGDKVEEKPKSKKAKAKEMAAQARKEAAGETVKGNMSKRFKDSKKVLGGGAYGEVKETAEGTVIKKGLIGAKEIEIQQKLDGVAGVPKIIDVEYSSKANAKGERKGIVEMEKAAGKSLMEQQFKLDNDLKGAKATKIADDYIKLRKEIHLRGVAHGDMHEGNLTWDGKKLGVLDFGLSKTGSKEALREAMGTKGNDVRAAGVLDGLRRDGGKSGKAQTRFGKNLEKMEKKLGVNNPFELMQKIDKMSDKKAQSLLEELYDGV